MRLRHIEVFNAVMLTGSVSAAARLINVTQPAVSRILAHAELQLGFALFHRLKGRLVPEIIRGVGPTVLDFVPVEPKPSFWGWAKQRAAIWLEDRGLLPTGVRDGKPLLGQWTAGVDGLAEHTATAGFDSRKLLPARLAYR